MKNKAAFIEYLKTRRASEDQIAHSLDLIEHFEAFLERGDYAFPSTDFRELADFAKQAIAGTTDASDRLIALARYCRFRGHNEGLTYVLSLLGTAGVLESIEARSNEVLGEASAQLKWDTLAKPPLGSPIEAYPDTIRELLERFEEKLSQHACRVILAGNHHQIPVESWEKDKRVHAEKGIDAYLKWRHESMLADMEECKRTGKLWYEQKITDRVLSFVMANQEIQAGVREGNTVFVTKIPYDPEGYLFEDDPVKKRFHACHCPFVRSSISSDHPVSDTWCYCTGGYEKQPFDAIYGKDLDVTVLETVLGGSSRCRFAIALPEER